MLFYQLADGTFVGTQGEAKKSGQEWESVEVPTDKPNLLEYLNANTRRDPDSTGDAGSGGSADPYPAVTDASRAPLTNCPRCSFDIASSQRVAKEWTRAAKVDAIVTFLTDDATTNQVAEVLSHLAERIKENAKAT